MQRSYNTESSKLLGKCWIDPSLYEAVLANPTAFGINAEVLAAFQRVDTSRLETLTEEEISIGFDSLRELMAGMCRLSC